MDEFSSKLFSKCLVSSCIYNVKVRIDYFLNVTDAAFAIGNDLHILH